MKKLCNHCFQEIKEGEKVCSLCKNPYVQNVEEDDSEPIIRRNKPTTFQISKGVIAIIISAFIALCAGAVGTWMYLQNPETPESVALDGINVLFNADIEEFKARHAFIAAEVGHLRKHDRAPNDEDGVEQVIWYKYNELETVIEMLRRGDLRITVVDSNEITESDKESALDRIYKAIIENPDEDPERTEVLESIRENIDSIYRVEIEVSEIDGQSSRDAFITVHVGEIDGKYTILLETLQ